MNTELLAETMQWVRDHPETHQQNHYGNRCGTAGCFAFWAVQLSGRHEYQGVQRWDSTGETTPYVAVRELGLAWGQANVLFEGSNSAEMLALMVKDLLNGDELRSTDEYMAQAHGNFSEFMRVRYSQRGPR